MAKQRRRVGRGSGELLEVTWDPITRVVGSLGIHAKVDLANRQVAQCHATSSIFRGYSIFMKGKDARDAQFITSRICGICGDNHATCAVYAQNMAFGVKPPPLADWIINLAEAAEYMFDHNLFQDNLVGVDFCERMMQETNPGVLVKAQRTAAPNAGMHGYATIGDLMRALNPFQGPFYREALEMSRVAREMYCLMGGRHAHPSTLYPGGVGTVADLQLLTGYLVRLMKYIDFIKRAVAFHDDLFDFFYQALPGYEEVGRRRILLGCWGSFQNPEVCDFNYATMSRWGREMFVTPGIIVDGELLTTDLVEINLGIRILLGSSFYDDWQGAETFVKSDPLGNPVDQRHPWNQTTIPKPDRRDFAGKYTWVMSPRWYDARGNQLLALDTGGGPLARLWSTALSERVRIGYIEAARSGVKIRLPKSAGLPETELEWKIPKWSNTHRAQSRTHLFPGLRRGCRSLLSGAGAYGDTRGPDQNLDRIQSAARGRWLWLPRGGSRAALPSPGDSRGQAGQLSSVSANLLERQPARPSWHAWPIRRRYPEHAHLRGKWPRQVQRD